MTKLLKIIIINLILINLLVFLAFPFLISWGNSSWYTKIIVFLIKNPLKFGSVELNNLTVSFINSSIWAILLSVTIFLLTRFRKK